MDEEKLALEARLTAIEFVLTHTAKIALMAAAHEKAPERAREFHDIVVFRLQEEFSIQGIDPALSDHMTDLIGRNVGRLLGDVVKVVDRTYGRPKRP